MTRSVWLKREPARAEAVNDGTITLAAVSARWRIPPPRAAQAASFEELFLRHYKELRKLLSGHTESGLGLAVVGTEGLEATAWFAAKEDEANPLIFGRHSSAEIFLPSDPRLSLRHLAVILHRRRPHASTRFRVLDLRTPTGFADEAGRPHEAIEAEGPVMVRCVSFAILMFPVDGSNAPWPEDAEAAWKRIPERVYVELPSEDGGRGLERIDLENERAVEADRRDITLVPSLPGPVFPSRDVVRSDPPRGELVVLSCSGRVSLRLGARAARQGVLLGRYDRCDTAGLPVLESPSLSRVHLLVIEVDGGLYAVDTASTNGTWLGARPLRSLRMQPETCLTLAHDATVEWRPFH